MTSSPVGMRKLTDPGNSRFSRPARASTDDPAGFYDTDRHRIELAAAARWYSASSVYPREPRPRQR